MPGGKPNKRYTPEFKIMAVETVHREKLSGYETAQQFEIQHQRISDWERIYLEEGEEAGCDFVCSITTHYDGTTALLLKNQHS